MWTKRDKLDRMLGETFHNTIIYTLPTTVLDLFSVITAHKTKYHMRKIAYPVC